MKSDPRLLELHMWTEQPLERLKELKEQPGHETEQLLPAAVEGLHDPCGVKPSGSGMLLSNQLTAPRWLGAPAFVYASSLPALEEGASCSAGVPS